jgi:hypothetical protein
MFMETSAVEGKFLYTERGKSADSNLGHNQPFAAHHIHA